MNLSALNLLSRASRTAVLTAVATLTVSVAHATPIAVVNGGFEQTTMNASTEFGAAYPSQQVTGWTTNGYNFVFLPGTADTTGATGQYGNVGLWGPGNGSNNGLKASPLGGNFIAMDGAFQQGALSQTLSGFNKGDTVTVSFYFAGAQQSGFYGSTTEQFEVSLGSQNDFTEVLNNSSQGFTGWKQENLTFTATGPSEVLSFLAIGTPSGVPPMSLLDGVSVTATPTPEPSSLVLMASGFAGAAGVLRRRFKK